MACYAVIDSLILDVNTTALSRLGGLGEKLLELGVPEYSVSAY